MHTKERFQLTLRWVCFGLLLTAVALRLASEITIQEAGAGLKRAWEALGFETAAETETQPERDIPTEEFPTMLYSLPAVEGTELPPVSVLNGAGVEFDADELLSRPIPIDLNVDGPIVLIVHTHASEAYTPADGESYEGASEYRTSDIRHNVIRVGQALADRLNAAGIQTLHDTTLNDAPGYDDAYERTAEVIARYLAEYPTIQMVIDVHRDAIVDADGKELPLSAEMNGRSAARLLLVMGTDASGLEHPNWQENLAFALKVQAHCEREAPGIFREMALRSGRYNEHFTPCSMLLEVGSAGNTLEEAVRSAEFFGDSLADLLLENTA